MFAHIKIALDVRLDSWADRAVMIPILVIAINEQDAPDDASEAEK